MRLRTLADVFAYAEAEGMRLRIEEPKPSSAGPSMHDQTAMRTDGIAERFRIRQEVGTEVDEGYRGLANESPTRSAPADFAPRSSPATWPSTP